MYFKKIKSLRLCHNTNYNNWICFFIYDQISKPKDFFICSLIIGITNASTRITRMTYFFNKIPNRLIGRTNTVFNTINTLIRSVLIAIFSHYLVLQGENVIVAYEIGVVVLIAFAIPLIFMQILKLTKNNSLSL